MKGDFADDLPEAEASEEPFPPLNAMQRDVLSALLWQPLRSIPELAEILPYRPHTIRHCLNRMRQSGAICQTALVDLTRLGFTFYNMYFSLSFPTPSDLAEVINVIRDHSQVIWLGEVEGGDYNFELTFAARTPCEFSEFIDRISSATRCKFAQREAVVEASHSYYGFKFLQAGGKRRSFATLGFVAAADRVSVDALDRKLLIAVCSGDFATDRAIAQLLGVPSSTVLYRKRRLQDAGVIVGEYYGAAKEKLPFHVFATLLYAKSTSVEFRDRLFAFCRMHPHVFVCHRCVGGWDFKIGIVADSFEDGRRALGDLRSNFMQDISNLQVYSQIRRIKDKFSPFDD